MRNVCLCLIVGVVCVMYKMFFGSRDVFVYLHAFCIIIPIGFGLTGRILCSCVSVCVFTLLSRCK